MLSEHEKVISCNFIFDFIDVQIQGCSESSWRESFWPARRAPGLLESSWAAGRAPGLLGEILGWSRISQKGGNAFGASKGHVLLFYF